MRGAMLRKRVSDVHCASISTAVRERWLRWMLQVVFDDVELQQFCEKRQFVATWESDRSV